MTECCIQVDRKGSSCNVLSAHASAEVKIDNTKDDFYEKLQRVSEQFPVWHTTAEREDF